MRLSRANMPLASDDRTHSQSIYPSTHYNLAPQFRPGFINLQHFCHSRWRNPVRLSKSGVTERLKQRRAFTSLNSREELVAAKTVLVKGVALVILILAAPLCALIILFIKFERSRRNL